MFRGVRSHDGTRIVRYVDPNLRNVLTQVHYLHAKLLLDGPISTYVGLVLTHVGRKLAHVGCMLAQLGRTVADGACATDRGAAHGCGQPYVGTRGSAAGAAAVCNLRSPPKENATGWPPGAGARILVDDPQQLLPKGVYPT